MSEDVTGEAAAGQAGAISLPSASVRADADHKSSTIYSGERAEFSTSGCRSTLPAGITDLLDRRNQADGVKFLAALPAEVSPLAFFDPQYRGVLDRQGYGNEGKRQKGRATLNQMTESDIARFLVQIERVLVPRGHLMLWVDKFHVAEGVGPWLEGLDLKIVDLITWDKGRIGMGYRTRRKCEYLMVIQKLPLRVKGVWTLHNIPDVWPEKLGKEEAAAHPHAKPRGLQTQLIAATTGAGDVVLDPAAGSFSVMDAALAADRHFLGCDILG